MKFFVYKFEKSVFYVMRNCWTVGQTGTQFHLCCMSEILDLTWLNDKYVRAAAPDYGTD